MDCIYWHNILNLFIKVYLESSRTGAEPLKSEAEPRARRAQGEQLLVWGPWGRTLTSPSNGQTNDRYLLIKPQQLWKEEKYFMNQNHLKRDVNVPHGKAATETLMLTVVSLASDDPGPELGTRRGEEERRRGGRGSYDVTGPE